MDRKWFLQLLGMGGIGSVLYSTHGSSHLSWNHITKPKRLQKGDRIGLVSPASKLPRRSEYREIVRQIKSMGYKVKVGHNAKKQYGGFAGTDEQRAADLNAMFADDSIDAILPFRGGWGSNRILDLIDFDIIRNNPKILVGFSDITSLLLATYAKTGLVTFHGPVGKSDWTDYTIRHFDEALTTRDMYTLETPDSDFCETCNDLHVIAPGKATGRLLGGNLSVLTAMIGSDYLPDWKGNLLFVEDIGEDYYRIDRMITQLELSGILDEISGFIFGQCASCEKSGPDSLPLNKVLEDHVKSLGVPAFSGAMFGHISNTITIPEGVMAEMDAEKGTIRLKETATS